MESRPSLHQGSSTLATPAKQDGLIGIINTINTMRQQHFKPIIIADFYCGSGENVIDGMPINGSPISILDGILNSVRRSKNPPKQPRLIVFNDIVSERVMSSLPHAVQAWQRKNNLPVDHEKLVCFTSQMHPFQAKIHYNAGPAQSLVEKIKTAIKRGYHVVALVDPNGPKDAPWGELRQIYESTLGSSMELIIHISSTTLKRVAKARQSTGMNFAPMPDHIQQMLDSFHGCGGWIREPVGADQWTMLLLSKFPPRNGWNPKTGPRFFRLDEPTGVQLVHLLSTTKSERGQ